MPENAAFALDSADTSASLHPPASPKLPWRVAYPAAVVMLGDSLANLGNGHPPALILAD
jgi:hypothetical protein